MVLNQAMLTQVLHELRLGNLQRCKALGLNEDDIYLLQSLPPTTLSRLAHATIPWVEVKIDSPVLHRLIEQTERDEQNERLINRRSSSVPAAPSCISASAWRIRKPPCADVCSR